MVGLNSRVLYAGQVTTIAALAEQGFITFTECEHYGREDVTAYFADIGSDSEWRISKASYAAALKRFNIVVSRPIIAEVLAPRGPYTFQEYQDAITARLASLPDYKWLVDYDFQDWRRDMAELLTLADSEIIALGDKILAEA